MTFIEELKKKYAKSYQAFLRWQSMPCEFCGNVIVEHPMLTMKEIEKYRRMGSLVTICETGEVKYKVSETFCFMCWVHPPSPEDPCDVEFMEAISG